MPAPPRSADWREGCFVDQAMGLDRIRKLDTTNTTRTREPIPLTFSPRPTAELKAAASFLRESIGDDLTISRADFAEAIYRSEQIPDPVQKDLMFATLEAIESSSIRLDGILYLPNETVKNLSSPALAERFYARANAAIAHPFVRALAEQPGGAIAAGQAVELLVRYFSDPVFEATIHQHAIPHGGTANAMQWAVGGEERRLHAIDALFGQCNETQNRTQEIFERFAASIEDRFGDGALELEGRNIIERSRVLLAYGLGGDARGDDHMLFAVRAKNGEEVYLDPWITQRADQHSVYRAADYQNMRQDWDASRWYEPGLEVTSRR